MYELYQNLWASIQYGESRLSILFNMESHYSPHRLQRGVTVDSMESVWTAGSVFFFNVEGLPLP
jgi:hypothetical protein